MFRRKPSAGWEPVIEQKTIETMFDITNEMRERLSLVTRSLESVLHVNATRRIITIDFKNFHGEADKKADLKIIENMLRQIAVQ